MFVSQIINCWLVLLLPLLLYCCHYCQDWATNRLHVVRLETPRVTLTNVYIICDESYKAEIPKHLPVTFRVTDAYSYHAAALVAGSLAYPAEVQLLQNISFVGVDPPQHPYNPVLMTEKFTLTTAPDVLREAGPCYVVLPPKLLSFVFSNDVIVS